VACGAAALDGGWDGVAIAVPTNSSIATIKISVKSLCMFFLFLLNFSACGSCRRL
jgi:hypothetical protein